MGFASLWEANQIKSELIFDQRRIRICYLCWFDSSLGSRVKLTFPIPWNLYGGVSKTGPQHFADMADTTAICILFLRVVAIVPQVFVQFRIQTGLHEFGDHFPKQLLYFVHVVHTGQLQQLPHLFSPGCLLRTSSAPIFLCHIHNPHSSALILHQFGSLLKVWDYFAPSSQPTTVSTFSDQYTYKEPDHHLPIWFFDRLSKLNAFPNTIV